MLDHEVAGAMTDWAEGKTEDVYDVPYGQATADEFLEDCFNYGGLTLFNISFADWLEELVRRHERLYEIMRVKYGR